MIGRFRVTQGMRRQKRMTQGETELGRFRVTQGMRRQKRMTQGETELDRTNQSNPWQDRMKQEKESDTGQGRMARAR
ncbi:hypothetical protein QE152_g19535 [Popillia japonica]|uniref:Uncharacterized protein n=1 Tax=Popillia japonica TaxID=7064 RepID=A0AAW1KNV3_POPJA